MFDRRGFLERAALLLAGAPVSACLSRADLSPSLKTNGDVQATHADDEWERIRREFELDYSYTHFAGFLIASHPRVVREEVERHRALLQSNPAACLSERELHEERVRTAAAKYLGVDKAQIALTGSTTMGLSLLYNGVMLEPGQEVLTSVHDHYATQEAWQFRSQRDGTKVRTISLFREAHSVSKEEVLAAVSANITDKTRVLALTWVHSGSGVKLPIADIGILVESINRSRAEADRVLFCVDGVHGFGVEDATFADLHCDFFVAGTHKWMFGPRGTGILCSRTKQLSNLVPTVASFSGDDDFGTAMTHGGFHAFEHQWSMDKAFEFHLTIGKRKVQARIHALNARLKERLSEVQGIELVTPRSSLLSAGFTFFRVRGLDPESVVKKLGESRIIASAADRDAGPVVRLAPGLLNNEAEIDRTVALLEREIAKI